MTLTHADYDQLFDKNLTVYGETKMIEVQKNYVITFTEEQARELYRLLQTEKDSGCLTPDRELKLVYHELKNLFDSGIR
jgi:CRISPR/Cas system-associated endonuclease/helicase Cas3